MKVLFLNNVILMKKLVFLSTLALFLTGCVSDDIGYKGPKNSAPEEEAANSFDFSTTADVNLSVDYSACALGTPVFFSVYSQNPLNGDTLKPGVKPIYSNFTDANGKFSQSIELPSYATDLYVYTGNFFVDEQLMNAQVSDNSVSVVASSNMVNAARRSAARRASELTNNLTSLYQLSYEVDYQTGNKIEGKQIYNDWKTWLGKWDSRTGRPEYIVKESDEGYSALTFTEEEMLGIRQSIAAAVVRKQTCPEEFRQSADLTLKQQAAVSVTLVGSNTCWNNTIGYYFYQGEAPTNLKDIHVVMLFPNTQDGNSQMINSGYSRNYNGNIALNRGEAVQLIYYPHIAEGSEEGATPFFPAGTKIGFLLKSNGWGMQIPHDGIKYHNAYRGASPGTLPRQYNCWAASTEGLSYCPENKEQNKWDDGSVKLPNPEGKSHTAKFAYEKDGQQYSIIAFEDAANDEDFGDVILALKPVGMFQQLPVPTSRTTSTSDVYAFEDLWPSAGDYDMNDALVEVEEDRVLTMFNYKNNVFMTKQIFKLTTDQNYVTIKSGLALTLEYNKSNAPTIEMKKILPGKTEAVEANFVKDGNVYLLTEDIKGELHTTYILELTYEGGIQTSNAAKVKPFLYRNEDGGKRWEVHIPMEAPTSKMDMSYFGTKNDKSDPDNKKYYVRSGDYPFAFRLSGVGIDAFKSTILDRNNESKAIDVFFPNFIEWSQSSGKKYTNWYLPTE